ncbi:MAG: hypothetical protein NTU62_11320 [Spirochaetes bacterium]|nr:hypothetical protein [Spirochaetota bacterium]
MMFFAEQCTWGFRLERDTSFQGDYMAGMGVCDDPSCPCAVVTIGCTESNPAPGDAKGIPYIFQLDLDARKVVKDLLPEARPESAEFAKSYVRELGEKEWAHLTDIFLLAKRALTENLNPVNVRHQFQVRDIENEATMVSYASVLPFDEKLVFTHDSREIYVENYYCLQSDRNSKSVHLVFHEKPATKKRRDSSAVASAPSSARSVGCPSCAA